ncbi:MAG: NAD(P)/FAD-dependent oxidoreductase [Thermodesulfobacteriota bacterium]|nr:NAD(P)/FAD-dependent oxidoreductase [Thermodesulfobacteriota bacterium]
MADYDVVVIGAGNGGLTAALSLARSGVKTLLLERHNVPGGCATTFVRGRFEMEVALHQLSGMGTDSVAGPLRGLLKGLGVMDKLEFVEQQNLYRLVIPEAFDITLKANRVEIEKTLSARFPQEKDGIKKFFDMLYTFCTQMISILYMHDPEARPEKYPLFYTYALKDAQGVIDQYLKDPYLQAAVNMYWGYAGLPPSKLSFSDFAIMLFAYIEFKPYHIKGGSQALSNAILDTFLEAAGDVRFNCGVKKIVIADNKVRSVITEDGDEISTQYVVSNAGPVPTFIDMIGPENCPAEQLKKLGARTIGPSAFTIYMGLDRDPADLGIDVTTNFICSNSNMEQGYAKWHTLDKPEYSLLSCYDIDDPDCSPPGACQCSLVNLVYGDPWLAMDPHQYYDFKYRYAAAMLELADKVFPGFSSHIEECEVASPLTHIRYLGHPGGSIYGSDQWPKESSMFLNSRSMIEGLFFAGAWNGSGGFQPTLESGGSVAKIIAKELGY